MKPAHRRWYRDGQLEIEIAEIAPGGCKCPVVIEQAGPREYVARYDPDARARWIAEWERVVAEGIDRQFRKT